MNMKSVLIVLSCVLASVELLGKTMDRRDMERELNRRRSKVEAVQRKGEPADLETVELLIDDYVLKIKSFGGHKSDSPLFRDPSKKMELEGLLNAMGWDIFHHVKLAEDAEKQNAMELMTVFSVYNGNARKARRWLLELFVNGGFADKLSTTEKFLKIADSSDAKDFWTDVKTFDEICGTTLKSVVNGVKTKKPIRLKSGASVLPKLLSLEELLGAAGLGPYLSAEGEIRNGLMGKFCNGACMLQDKGRTRFGDKWIQEQDKYLKELDAMHTEFWNMIKKQKNAAIPKIANLADSSYRAMQKVFDMDERMLQVTGEFIAYHKINIDKLKDKSSYAYRFRRGGELKNFLEGISSAEMGEGMSGCHWLDILRKRCVKVRVDLMETYQKAFHKPLPLHPTPSPQF